MKRLGCLLTALVTVLLILMFLSIAIVILRSTVQVRKTHRFKLFQEASRHE